ncbi:MAG: AMP-binding protein [Geminicoccaceae bacterium]
MFQRSAGAPGRRTSWWIKETRPGRPELAAARRRRRCWHAASWPGPARGDRVMLVAENRPEWCVADLAILMAGGITVPAYTSPAPARSRLPRHCEARVVYPLGPALAKRLMPAAKKGTARVEPSRSATRRAWSRRSAAGSTGSTRSPRASRACHRSRRIARHRRHGLLDDTSGTGGRAQGRDAELRQPDDQHPRRPRLLEQIGLGDEVFLSSHPCPIPTRTRRARPCRSLWGPRSTGRGRRRSRPTWSSCPRSSPACRGSTRCCAGDHDRRHQAAWRGQAVPSRSRAWRAVLKTGSLPPHRDG